MAKKTNSATVVVRCCLPQDLMFTLPGGRKLTFKVTLADEKGPVGGGTHERFVIFEEKFAAKAEAKKG